MTKQTTHVQVVREWLLSLGVLSAASATRQEAQMKLAAYVPLLMERFPDVAFTTASLEHVAARAVKGFPTYGELADWLSAWWRDNRPRPIALPEPPPPAREPPATPEQIAQVRALARAVTAELRSAAMEREMPMGRAGPRYLTPEQLDLVNPLAGGRKRVPQPAAYPARDREE